MQTRRCGNICTTTAYSRRERLSRRPKTTLRRPVKAPHRTARAGSSVLPFQYGVPKLAVFFRLAATPFELCLAVGAAGVQTRMPQQPESTSSTLALSPATLPDPDGNPETGQPPIEHVPQRIPKWLERIELLLRVMLRMYIGLAVCYAPWSPMFWDQNPLFLQFPMLAHFAAHGAVRGIVSGLGLLNLWYALQDVLRHREG